MTVFDSRKTGPTKEDLERVLTIAEIFDILNPDKQDYRLRQIVAGATARFNMPIKVMETSLKKVNDVIPILVKTGYEGNHYLYSPRMDSAEAKEAIEKYRSKNYKTPLKKLPYVVRSHHIEEFQDNDIQQNPF